MAGSPLKRERREQAAAQAAKHPDLKPNTDAARLQAIRDQHDVAARLPTEARNRPVAYHPDLIPELFDLADLGLSPAEIAAHWCLSEDELEGMQEAHADFGAAFHRARARAKAWWERQARVAVKIGDTRFAAGAWSHLMRAKFPEYDEKRGVTVNLHLGDLVLMDLRKPEPTHGRLVQGSNPLADNGTVILEGSQTVEGSVVSPRSGGDDTA